jgi:transmembrane 9 superfamily protein 2/4
VEKYRVVVFAVYPMSILHRFQGGYTWDGKNEDYHNKKMVTCPSSGHHLDRSMIQANQLVDENAKILYTYDVIWKKSDVSWSSRWDIYLSENQLAHKKIHWYSDYQSHFSWFSFWSLCFISTLIRNLRRDAAAYKALAALADDERDEDMDESGWKLVHADVFAPPPPDNYPMLYGVFVGSGDQLAFTILLSIIFSAVGFLNPARRGSLMNAIFMVFFMLSGIISGFVSSHLYKSFKGHLWQLCTVITAILFPGVALLLYTFFNIILFF